MMITPEEWTKHFRHEKRPKYVRYLANPKLPRKNCPMKFDERDIIRFSTKDFLLVYTPPNASGFFQPRLIERD